MATDNNDERSFTKDDTLDDDTEDLISRPVTNGGGTDQQRQTWNPVHATIALLGLIYARIVYHCAYHRTESILFSIFLCSLVLLIHNASSGGGTTNRSDPFLHSKIDSHLSNIRSEFDLRVGDVDHWCIMGGNDECQCEDPTEPSFRQWKGWVKAHKKNVERAEIAAGLAAGEKPVLSQNIEEWDDDWDDGFDDDFGFEEMLDDDELKTLEENGYDRDGNEVVNDYSLDVVFFGDTFTEQRQGTASGNIEDDFTGIKTVFDKQFTKDKGGLFEGLSLGLAGDTCPNLLWRIINGEIPYNLNPKVFWITIGTNDMLRTQCSEEVVLLGILRIVEEIQNRKPSATIVINSILPISNDPSGVLAYKSKSKQMSMQKKAMKKSGKAYFDLWPPIVSVNEELEKFVSEQPGVKFFDASKVFVEERSDGFYLVDGAFMPDNIHPSKQGHKAWGKAITERLGTILNKE